MKHANFLLALAILGFGLGSISLPVSAQTVVEPASSTSLSKSASLGTVEVSPESKAEFQPANPPAVVTITLPEAPAPGLFERMFSSLSLPSSGSSNLPPGQFDPPYNRGVGLINGNI